jgi:hypothetical protein
MSTSCNYIPTISDFESVKNEPEIVSSEVDMQSEEIGQNDYGRKNKTLTHKLYYRNIRGKINIKI